MYKYRGWGWSEFLEENTEGTRERACLKFIENLHSRVTGKQKSQLGCCRQKKSTFETSRN